MEKIILKSFDELLQVIGHNKREDNILFRGQVCDAPLLPKVARKNPKINSASLEKEMLQELRRIGGTYLEKEIDDWDLLVYAQHFGMATRLLDWTSNPLVAVWFACCDLNPKQSSYLYILLANNDLMLNKASMKSPFNNGRTKIIKPNLNNKRIIGQSGWFTAHIYSNSSSKFVPLENNPNVTHSILRAEIPGSMKEQLLNKCNLLGVNYQTIFPDIEGICKHINWLKL